MTVNWQKPIEAVHTDGRVVAVCLRQDTGCPNPDDGGDYYTTGQFGGYSGIWRPNGSSWGNLIPQWTIRNTPQATETPRTAPSQENGSGEAFERMKALCEAVCALNLQSCSLTGTPSHNVAVEARAIMALLAPVDGDLVEARKAVSEMKVFQHVAHQVLAGKWDDLGIIAATRDAIRDTRAGRQLERGGE